MPADRDHARGASFARARKPNRRPATGKPVFTAGEYPQFRKRVGRTRVSWVNGKARGSFSRGRRDSRPHLGVVQGSRNRAGERMVGPAGFEPTTSCAPCMRATRLRYGPKGPHRRRKGGCQQPGQRIRSTREAAWQSRARPRSHPEWLYAQPPITRKTEQETLVFLCRFQSSPSTVQDRLPADPLLFRFE